MEIRKWDWMIKLYVSFMYDIFKIISKIFYKWNPRNRRLYRRVYKRPMFQ